MFKTNKDGVELLGLGKCTLDDVYNDPNGISNVEEDNEYYYVFPCYKPGYCGDSLWMVNKKTLQVSFTNMSTLVVHDVLDKLTEVPFDVFKKRVSV